MDKGAKGEGVEASVEMILPWVASFALRLIREMRDMCLHLEWS